jgi:large subunit ribosomal protein L15
MELNSLKPGIGSTHNSKRIGRGQGSGKGGTAARGHKGAKSRSGYSQKAGFEGGQMPLYRRVPKFGFKPVSRVEYKPINLYTIQELAEKKGLSVITNEVLLENGLSSKGDLIKVLSSGELKLKLDITANAFSDAAIAAIEKAGGKATKA